MYINVPDYEIMALPNGELALTFPLAEALQQHLPQELSWDGQGLVLTAVAPISSGTVPTSHLSSGAPSQKSAQKNPQETRLVFAPLPPEGYTVLRGHQRLWMCGLKEGTEPLVFGCEFPMPEPLRQRLQ